MSVLSKFSSREKRLWGELSVDIIVSAYYFPKLYTLYALGNETLTNPNFASLIFSTIKLSIFCAIILAIIISIFAKNEPKDERDNQFSSKAFTFAFWTLSACIALLIGQIVINEIFPGHIVARAGLSPLIMSNLLLMSLILSGWVKSITQIFLYRRGY